MKRIAIPIFGDRISNRLDCSENILLVSIEEGEIKKRETIRLLQTNQSVKLSTLVDLGMDVLICNGITKFYSRRLSESNIRIIPWISGEVEEVLGWYLEGKLISKDSRDSDKT